jgi:hypothetical protein
VARLIEELSHFDSGDEFETLTVFPGGERSIAYVNSTGTGNAEI